MAVPEVSVRAAYDAVNAGAYFLDVREQEEFDAGHAVGVTSIPISVIGQRLDEIPKDREIYVICRSGSRSASVTEALNSRGYSASNVFSGMLDWYGEDLPMESENGEKPTVI